MLQSRQRVVELRSRTSSRRRKKRLEGGGGDVRPATHGEGRLFSRERKREIEPPEVRRGGLGLEGRDGKDMWERRVKGHQVVEQA